MTNNDDLALKPEQIEWLHEAAEEHASVGLKMTMKPDDMLQLTSTLRTLLAERTADKAENASLLQRVAELEEIADLQRDKIKRLESDLWDEQQLRKVHSEKSFELDKENRELKHRNDKDFIWRGEEIVRLNDERCVERKVRRRWHQTGSGGVTMTIMTIERIRRIQACLEALPRRLYCPECGAYLEGGDGELKDCLCGWKQPVTEVEE